MPLSDRKLQNLKQATARALQSAEASGQADQIERARKLDEAVDELIKNNNRGGISIFTNAIRFGILLLSVLRYFNVSAKDLLDLILAILGGGL